MNRGIYGESHETWDIGVRSFCAAVGQRQLRQRRAGIAGVLSGEPARPQRRGPADALPSSVRTMLGCLITYRLLRLARTFFSSHSKDKVIDCLSFEPYSDILRIRRAEGHFRSLFGYQRLLPIDRAGQFIFYIRQSREQWGEQLTFVENPSAFTTSSACPMCRTVSFEISTACVA